MNRFCALWFAVVLLTAPVFPSDKGTRQERLDSMEDLTEGLARDGVYIVTAPLRPTKKGLLITAAGVTSVGILMGFDKKIGRSIQHSKKRTFKKFMKDLDENEGIERFGRSSGVMITCASFYGAGLVTDSTRTKRVAYIGLESWFFNDSITKVLKAGFGRERPADDPYNFDSFGGNSSMPSGHASTAFCLASVIAGEYDSILVDSAAYGTAGMVAFSRLYRNVHWASDVVASAFLGIAIGKATRHLYTVNPRDWTIVMTDEQLILVRRFGGTAG